LGRFGFGARPNGPKPSTRDAWWTSQLAIAAANPTYTANPAVAAVGPQLTLTPAQARAWLVANGDEYGWDVMDERCLVTLGCNCSAPAASGSATS
jgi:hypothetical protein